MLLEIFEVRKNHNGYADSSQNMSSSVTTHKRTSHKEIDNINNKLANHATSSSLLFLRYLLISLISSSHEEL